jgi:hypothetical protein
VLTGNFGIGGQQLVAVPLNIFDHAPLPFFDFWREGVVDVFMQVLDSSGVMILLPGREGLPFRWG